MFFNLYDIPRHCLRNKEREGGLNTDTDKKKENFGKLELGLQLKKKKGRIYILTLLPKSCKGSLSLFLRSSITRIQAKPEIS